MTPVATPGPPADPEGELRAQFRALRQAAARLVPRFDLTWAALPQARARAAWRRLGALALATVAAAGAAGLALGVVGLWPRRERPALVDLRVTRWEAPTDFLLRAPGSELWRAVPSFTTDGRLLP